MRVWKSGSYGKVGWHHELSCGHVEVRKRKAPADVMACLQCDGQAPAAPVGVEIDPVVALQSTEARVKSLISRRLGVPVESISVVFGLFDTTVIGVRIELDQGQVENILTT